MTSVFQTWQLEENCESCRGLGNTQKQSQQELEQRLPMCHWTYGKYFAIAREKAMLQLQSKASPGLHSFYMFLRPVP